jgi:hypothetical protein
MAMPDKITAEFHEFEVVVVHPSDDLGGLVFRKLGKFFF